jgi:hypothetical protein
MHFDLTDPMTWVLVVVAAFVIAGLRWLVRRRRGG